MKTKSFYEKMMDAERAAHVAHHDIYAALKERFPVGEPVQCFFNDAQKVPSNGTVIGYSDDARITIKLTNINQRGYHTIKRVSWRRCL